VKKKNEATHTQKRSLTGSFTCDLITYISDLLYAHSTNLKNMAGLVFIEQLEFGRPGNNKKAQCFSGPDQWSRDAIGLVAVCKTPVTSRKGGGGEKKLLEISIECVAGPINVLDVSISR
jgi:hypothetical protein